MLAGRSPFSSSGQLVTPKAQIMIVTTNPTTAHRHGCLRNILAVQYTNFSVRTLFRAVAHLGTTGLLARLQVKFLPVSEEKRSEVLQRMAGPWRDSDSRPLRVNYEVQKLNPLACLAFSFPDSLKRPSKEESQLKCLQDCRPVSTAAAD